MEIGTNPEQLEIDKTADVSLSPDIDPDEVIGPETVEALPETANDVIDPDEVIEPETVEALPETANDVIDPDEVIEPETVEPLPETASDVAESGEVIEPETVEPLPETASDVAESDEVIEPETVEPLPETASDVAESDEATLPEGEGSDVGEAKRYTTKEERMEVVKHNVGIWSDELGNSKFTPNDAAAQEKLAQCGVDGIEYKDWFADFSKVAAETVEISNMTPDIQKNRSQAYKALADKWNKEAKDGRTDWTSRDVQEWKQENNLEFHECPDLKTCQFVPAEIHQACKHTGGRAEAIRRDAAVSEGGFDD